MDLKDLATDKKEKNLIPVPIWIAITFLILSIIGFGIYDRYKEYKQEQEAKKVINEIGQFMSNIFKPIEQKTKIIYVEKEPEKKPLSERLEFSSKNTKNKD